MSTVVGGVGAGSVLAPAAPALAATSAPQIVISGLNNPRGVTFSGGTLYVAESGAGGSGFCLKSSEGSSVCYGATGAITAVSNAATVNGRVAASSDRLISGLPSLATQTDDPSTPQPDQGTSATGPSDVSVAADGTLYFVVGLGAPPADRDAITKASAPGGSFAALWSAKADGTGLTKVASLGDYEAAHNPDNGIVPTSSLDTNPYSVLVSGSTALVADAGGNDVLSVNRSTGAVSTAAVLPPLFAPAPPFLNLKPGTMLPTQPVPTSLAAGPNGATYVGQLTGFPFPQGGASVFTLTGTTLTPFASGFTNVIDETVGPDGNLYVLEIAHNSLLGAPPVGALLRVSPNGGSKQLLLNNLNFPGGIAFGPDGMAYISTCSVCTGKGPTAAQTGNVVRFDAVGATPLLTRLSGADRVATAIATSRATFPNGAPAVVIARSDDFADALAGSVLAGVGALPGSSPDGTTNVPLLLTPGAQLSPQTAAEIKRLGATTAYVLGQQSAISDATAAALTSQAGVTNVVRVGGANRFATAAAIKAKVESLIGRAVDGVYVVTGGGFADAMSVAPLAAHQVRPILLVTPTQLPADTAEALSGVNTATIVGGTAAVSAAVSDAIGKIVTTVAPRLSGNDRYATSAAVANAAGAAGLSLSKLWLATGVNWPDAVAAGSAVADAGGVLVLVSPADLAASPATKALIAGQAGTGSATLLGGPAALSITVEGQVISSLGG
ncbi:MAG TPA: ScyD/ScyE family protein [Acidothermaceae bacterium]